VDWAEVAGQHIGFQQAGDGPALLLVHGALSDSRVWERQLAAFSDEFTVIAWDAPGCGQSADPPESFRLAEYADVLGGLIAALGLERAHVLGHSFGGALALELARRQPEVVATLILVGGYAGWAGSLPPAEVERRLAFAVDAADRHADRFDPESMRGLFSDKLPPESAATLRTIMSESRPVATRTMAYALAEADLRDSLASIRVPTLLVHGDADERSTLKVAAHLHRGIPESILVVLPGLGHECYLEDSDRFNAEVRVFLDAKS
jgi:pimeloyl-ACP methyl ester carboxylesterase